MFLTRPVIVHHDKIFSFQDASGIFFMSFAIMKQKKGMSDFFIEIFVTVPLLKNHRTLASESQCTDNLLVRLGFSRMIPDHTP